MQQKHDTRKQCEENQAQAFVNACAEEFTPKPLHIENAAQAKRLELISYLPSALSAITLIFLVVTLLGGYPDATKYALGGLLCAVILGAEYAKRQVSYTGAKKYAVTGKIPIALLILLVALVAGSMAGSYQGGNYLVHETTAAPTLPDSPELDSINAAIQREAATIQALQNTKWKGSITREATKGITAAKATQNALLAKVERIEAARADELAELTTQADGKTLALGWLLGGVAACADLLLIGLLFRSVWLRYEVAELVLGGNDAEQAQQERSGAYTLDRSAQPTAQPTAQTKLPIGFYRPPTNGSSSNGQSSNGQSSDAERSTVYVGPRTRECDHCKERYAFKSAKSKFCSTACRKASWEGRTGKRLPNFKKS